MKWLYSLLLNGVWEIIEFNFIYLSDYLNDM